MDTNRLTKAEALSLFGSVVGVQRALGLKNHTTVSMWPELVPPEHYLRIRYQLRPDAFDADGAYIGPAPAESANAA